MVRQRSETEQQIAELLRTAKSSLQISVAFLSVLVWAIQKDKADGVALSLDYRLKAH